MSDSAFARYVFQIRRPELMLDAFVKRTGGEQVIAITLARPIERKDYVLVLG